MELNELKESYVKETLKECEDELRKRLAISVNGDFVKADRILERIRSLSSVITITGVSRRK